MKLNKEEDLLSLKFRQQFLASIASVDNVARKKEAKKRYEIFKDNSKKFVLEAMAKESKDGKNIIPEIESRASCISFCRKIIDKKAMVYKNPIERSFKNQEQLDAVVDLLNVDTVLKKANKYVELFKNTLIHVFPWQDMITGKYNISLRVLAPYDYDVLEDSNNPEYVRAVVYSYEIGMGNDGKPQLNYIWWSTSYHFTTDDKGVILADLSPENYLNPIEELPFVDLSEDKDNAYWAKGGDDIINCDILLNIAITDLNYIIKYQSAGIFYVAGAGVPKEMKVGPSAMFTLEKREGDPPVDIGFATSNPPIDSVLSAIEQHLNFVLSTNSLETGSISGKITAKTASSGLQEMINRSENIDDIKDQQSIYCDAEPLLFRKIFKFLNEYGEKQQLNEIYKDIGKVDTKELVVTKFAEPTIIQTEKDKLDMLQQRKELGLDTQIDLVRKDNPEMSEEDAIKKLAEIKAEKVKNALEQAKNSIINNEEEKDDVANGQQSNLQN